MSQQNNIAGPGQGLQLPQYLYPTELYNAPYDYSSNELTLAPGDAIPIPAGSWLIWPGQYSVLQFLDPVTGIWRIMPAGERGGPQVITSDGFTRRIANLTGCPIAARVDNGGTGYTQATATITASTGSSTWQPIVGGQCSVISVGTAGASYTMQPLVLIPAPPSPGVAATAVANISAGSVTGVTLTNIGAGYTSIPTAVILPNPADPNYATITQASVVLGTVGSGKITAALCTNNGAPVTSAPTLTPAGSTGTTATLTAVLLQTLTTLTMVSAGTGYDASTEVQTVGGLAGAGANTNPAIEMTNFRPRKASVKPTITGGTLAATGTIYDGGLFAVGTAPTAVILTNGVPTTAASVTLGLGSANDTVIMQQL